MPKKENPLRQLPVSSDGYGDIKIHLAEILEEKNSLDIDILKRLSYVLECNLTDLIEYIPPEETQTLQ